jgi:hypothetical protein
LQAARDAEDRRKEDKPALKERRAEGAAIKKRLDEQCSINGMMATFFYFSDFFRLFPKT